MSIKYMLMESNDAQKISRQNAPSFNGLEVGLKRKKHKIKGDWSEPAKNPSMLKLVFPLEFKNSNFRSSGILLSFDVDESLYSELWSGYLFSNFLNVYGS